ncbi:MAG: helix-turn-helix domain-containing protein [Candidatus Aenigmatarchaeota archaeon]
MKSKLVGEIKEFLRGEGFELCQYSHGCFDLAAKRDELLLLKILQNVGSLQREQARDLKVLSRSLSATPFLLGERTRRENLEEGAVYQRFGLPVLTVNAFKSLMHGEYPERFRSRGGFFGKIKPERLRDLRKREGMTQKELAERIGVSQKSISEHESGLERMVYSMIEALETVLQDEIGRDVDPFEMKVEVSRKNNKDRDQVEENLEKIGFKINYTKRAPPQIIAREENTVMSRKEGNKKVLERITPVLQRFSEVSETPAFLITEEGSNSEKLPKLSEEELTKIENSKELIKIIKERKED